MDMLQQLEFVVSSEVAGVQDRALPSTSIQHTWGGWSLLPTAFPSDALRRRLAVAARVRSNRQAANAAQVVA